MVRHERRRKIEPSTGDRRRTRAGGHGRHTVRRGRVMALVFLAIFLVWEASDLVGKGWRARFASLFVSARLAADERAARQGSLPFDPDYGPFLEAVRGAIPPG